MIRHDDDVDDDNEDDDGDGDPAVSSRSAPRTDGGTGGEERDPRTNLTSPPPRECQLAWSRATAARDGYNPENNGPPACARASARDLGP